MDTIESRNNARLKKFWVLQRYRNKYNQEVARYISFLIKCTQTKKIDEEELGECLESLGVCSWELSDEIQKVLELLWDKTLPLTSRLSVALYHSNKLSKSAKKVNS